MGAWFIVSRQLYYTILGEELFVFSNKKMPYLCGLWRFANAYNGISDGGKDNLMAAIKRNILSFQGKRLLLIIDFCGFGSCLDDLVYLSERLDIIIIKDYLSFEYFLLKSKFINDDIDSYIEENRLGFYSIEDLCTKRLKDLTKGTLFSYKKGANDFSVCYYLNCCSNPYNKGICKINRNEFSKDKVINMINGTDFECFLNYI